MSKLYAQHNLMNAELDVAYGGGGGGRSSNKKKSSKRSSSRVYIGGHVGYVDKRPTWQDRHDNASIVNGGDTDCSTANKIAYGAGAVSFISTPVPVVSKPAGAVSLTAGTYSALTCGFN